MIEQHDAYMRELRGEREAPEAPQAPPVEPPEGVALYQCHQLVPDPAYEDGFHICGRGQEDKPYAPIPYHCDRPMTLVGYDWTRDLAE